MMKKFLKSFSIHSVLIFTSLLSIFPFIWLLSTSLKGNSENIFAYPPALIPKEFTFANYVGVWHRVDLMRYFINSMVVAGGTVILNLILSSLAITLFLFLLRFVPKTIKIIPNIIKIITKKHTH